MRQRSAQVDAVYTPTVTQQRALTMCWFKAGRVLISIHEHSTGPSFSRATCCSTNPFVMVAGRWILTGLQPLQARLPWLVNRNGIITRSKATSPLTPDTTRLESFFAG